MRSRQYTRLKNIDFNVFFFLGSAYQHEVKLSLASSCGELCLILSSHTHTPIYTRSKLILESTLRRNGSGVFLLDGIDWVESCCTFPCTCSNMLLDQDNPGLILHVRGSHLYIFLCCNCNGFSFMIIRSPTGGSLFEDITFPHLAMLFPPVYYFAVIASLMASYSEWLPLPGNSVKYTNLVCACNNVSKTHRPAHTLSGMSLSAHPTWIRIADEPKYRSA